MDEGIHLITMHGAKGLEFDTVFIIEANEGVTPYKKAKIVDEIEEERRLFYVGITRAMENLWLTSTVRRRINGKILFMRRSPFIEELPRGVFKFVNNSYSY